jgi:hypothetical protein
MYARGGAIVRRRLKNDLGARSWGTQPITTSILPVSCVACVDLRLGPISDGNSGVHVDRAAVFARTSMRTALELELELLLPP